MTLPNHPNVNLHAIAREAMRRYGFQYQFPEPLTQEVNALQEDLILKNERDEAKDLRSLLWSSIDNVDSLDLDQLEYCERGAGQEIAVKIAIADVDSFVPKNSQSDKYAAHNGTSVYTGVEVFPMLPERLSTDLTSLRANQDRLAIVVEFTVLADGNIRSGDIYRALVCNKAKLVYEAVGEWLEKKQPALQAIDQIPALKDQLLLQDEAAQRLREFRKEQGALELESIEAKPVVREDKITALVASKKNRARYIIENFMIAANATMIHFFEKAGIPAIQRIVRVPRNWQEIVDVAAACGEDLPLEPDSKALSQFLMRRKDADPERFPDLSLTIVKLLGPGEYVVLVPGKSPLGHFGLAVTDYTHSTAPNRRYVDVIIQRLLKSALNGKPPSYTQEELAEHSAWCTERDGNAKKVQRFMRKAIAAILLSDHLGESFDAIVTGASEKGTYVRLLAPLVEGRVVRREKGMVVGRKVRVRLISMDPYKGHIDFEKMNTR